MTVNNDEHSMETATNPSSDSAKSNPGGRDKRDSFRIDKDVHFEFRPVSASFVEDNSVEEAFEEDDQSLRLIGELSKIDRDMLQSIKVLADKNRFLGEILKSMNDKIDTIGRHIAFNSEESLRSRPKTRVSISEDGMGFICDRSFYKGNFIAVRLIFLPKYIMASAYAKVVRCVQKDDKYQIAAKFHAISDKDRQIISRYVLKSQVESRKKPAK